MNEVRKCRVCGERKEIAKFEFAGDPSRAIRRRVCHSCRAQAKNIDPERRRASARKYRQLAPHVAVAIDCRKTDRKKGLQGNDLNSEIVRDLFAGVVGCIYCGETKLKMTLDRIDNARAHSRDNVVPCCIRCNYIRGSMPYEAWLVLVPKVKEARERGLFGEWRAVPLRRARQVAKGEVESRTSQLRGN